MAIQFVGGVTGTGTGASYTVSLSGTLTGGIATSPAADDLIVVYAGHGNSASSAPTCSGNTSGAYVSAHTALAPADTWVANLGTFYRFAGATPDTSLTIGRTNNTTHGGATVVLVFRGVSLVTSATTATGINGAAVDAPAVTPTVAGSWVVAGGCGTTPSAGTAGMTAISNLTAVSNAYGDGSTADASTIAGYYSGWTTGAFDPAAATGGTLTNNSSSWGASSIVLQPANASAISTLTENFDGTLDATKWYTYNPGVGTVTFTSGELVLTPDQTNGYSAILYNSNAQFFDLDSVYVKLTRRLTTANAAAGGYTDFNVFDNDVTGTYVGFRVTTNGVLTARTVSAGTVLSSVTISTTWDTDATPWLKISKSSGTVTWWTAPGTTTPGTWTSRSTNGAPPVPFHLAKVWLATQNDDWVTTGALTGTAKFDGLNTATSAGTNVALTGQAATASRGALGVTAAITLTGQQATSVGGALATSITTALSGQQASTASGNLAPNFAIALTGQAATAARGALGTGTGLIGQQAAAGSGTLGVGSGLGGQAATSAAGTLGVTASVAISGLQASSSGGALGVTASVVLTGQQAASARGTLGTAVNAALTGQQAASAGGTLTSATSIALTGQQAAASNGALSTNAATNVALTGQQAAASGGALATAVMSALTGLQASAARGTLGVNNGASTALQDQVGFTLTDQTGDPLLAGAPTSAVTLTGLQATTARGALTAASTTPVISVALTGLQAVSAGGALSKIFSVPLTGYALTLSQSTLGAPVVWSPADGSAPAVWAAAGAQTTTWAPTSSTGTWIDNTTGSTTWADAVRATPNWNDI